MLFYSFFPVSNLYWEMRSTSRRVSSHPPCSQRHQPWSSRLAPAAAQTAGAEVPTKRRAKQPRGCEGWHDELLQPDQGWLWPLFPLLFTRVACWMHEPSPRRSCSLQTHLGLPPSQMQHGAPDHGCIQMGSKVSATAAVVHEQPWPVAQCPSDLASPSSNSCSLSPSFCRIISGTPGTSLTSSPSSAALQRSS